jgi:hypothetical protein
MSWKIESLILNRLYLKENPDLESEDYNNLLIIEKKAKELYELKILSLLEAQILNYFSNGSTLTDISKEIDLSKDTVILVFRRACEKISFCLGGEFTDFGTIDELIDKYDLSSEQIENLITYMNSEYKHKLSRIKK